MILGLETSCDETSAAVIEAPLTIKGHVIYSQDEHALYGGVVPEIAARAHLQRVDEVAAAFLREMVKVAVVQAPGPATGRVDELCPVGHDLARGQARHRNPDGPHPSQ